jgi:hypothetical protein
MDDVRQPPDVYRVAVINDIDGLPRLVEVAISCAFGTLSIAQYSTRQLRHPRHLRVSDDLVPGQRDLTVLRQCLPETGTRHAEPTELDSEIVGDKNLVVEGLEDLPAPWYFSLIQNQARRLPCSASAPSAAEGKVVPVPNVGPPSLFGAVFTDNHSNGAASFSGTV